MTKPVKYSHTDEEQAYLNMYSGLAASTKNKIAKARKFPKEVMERYDLFKPYFLSAEGLPAVIKKLSAEEIVLLHILNFNEWIVDTTFFEAAYVPMPKPQKWGRYGTFTQLYGSVLKSIQNKLVQQSLLVQYKKEYGGDSKAERQRFMFPSAFAPYLPSPFFKLAKIEGTGISNDENIRKQLLAALHSNSPKTKETI